MNRKSAAAPTARRPGRQVPELEAAVRVGGRDTRGGHPAYGGPHLRAAHRRARIGHHDAADEARARGKLAAAAKEVDPATPAATAALAGRAALRLCGATAALAQDRNRAGECTGEEEQGGGRTKRGAHDVSIDVPVGPPVVPVPRVESRHY